VIVLDQGQGEVDPRRDAGRGVEIAVADEDRIDLDTRRRIASASSRRVPMGRHSLAVDGPAAPSAKAPVQIERNGAPRRRLPSQSGSPVACRRPARRLPTQEAYRPAAAAPSLHKRHEGEAQRRRHRLGVGATVTTSIEPPLLRKFATRTPAGDRRRRAAATPG